MNRVHKAKVEIRIVRSQTSVILTHSSSGANRIGEKRRTTCHVVQHNVISLFSFVRRSLSVFHFVCAWEIKWKKYHFIEVKLRCMACADVRRTLSGRSFRGHAPWYATTNDRRLECVFYFFRFRWFPFHVFGKVCALPTPVQTAVGHSFHRSFSLSPLVCADGKIVCFVHFPSRRFRSCFFMFCFCFHCRGGVDSEMGNGHAGRIHYLHQHFVSLWMGSSSSSSMINLHVALRYKFLGSENGGLWTLASCWALPIKNRVFWRFVLSLLDVISRELLFNE